MTTKNAERSEHFRLFDACTVRRGPGLAWRAGPGPSRAPIRLPRASAGPARGPTHPCEAPGR